MKEEMMTTGFTGGDAATGPTAGYDPVMKFRKKLKKRMLRNSSALVINLVRVERILECLRDCFNIK